MGKERPGAATETTRLLSPVSAAAGPVSTFPPPRDRANEESVEDRYRSFFSERDATKHNLYRNVVNLGLVLVGLDFSLFAAQAIESAEGLSSVIVESTVLVGNVIFSLGACLLSVVPTDEFDVDRGASGCLSMCLRFCLGALMAAFGAYNVAVVFPYAQGAPCVFVGGAICASMLCARSLRDDAEQSRGQAACCRVPRYSTFLLCGVFAAMLNWATLTCTMAVQATGPLLFPSAAAAGRFNFPGSYYEILAPAFEAHRVLGAALYVTSGAVRAAFLLVGIILAARTPTAHVGWGTSRLYASAYMMMGMIGAVDLIDASFAFYDDAFTDSLSRALEFTAGVLILLPIATTLVLGKKRSFALLARYFELDLGRMQRDGALMAELASSSQVLDGVSRRRWVQRRAAAADMATGGAAASGINRQLWALGFWAPVRKGGGESGASAITRLASEEDSCIDVTIFMEHDIDPSWSA